MMASKTVKAAAQQLGRDQIVESGNNDGDAQALHIGEPSFKGGHDALIRSFHVHTRSA